MKRVIARGTNAFVLGWICIAACGGSDSGNGSSNGSNTTQGAVVGAPGAPGSAASANNVGVAGTGAAQTPLPGVGVAGTGSAVPNSAGVAGSAAPPVTPPNGAPGQAAPPATTPAGAAGTAAPAPAGNMPMPSSDPEDGDPSMPVFTNPDMACRMAGGFSFGGLNQPNFKVDNRDVIIDYPCNKHEGAPMTFILNLHGTTPVEQHFYQEGYFSAWQFVASHNLIIATPSSVVQQWGNGDNGQDEPYLMDVIAYVYKAFAKFDIKQMWVGGHSWGAMYTATFGCKPELADKVKGLIIMSGLPTVPACGSTMSLLNTVAEMDIGPAIDFGNLPMQHGCGAQMMAMLGNNTETFWPNCTAPYVHAKYKMLGKMHTDFMDKEVVQSLVDWIKISRQSQK